MLDTWLLCVPSLLQSPAALLAGPYHDASMSGTSSAYGRSHRFFSEHSRRISLALPERVKGTEEYR